MKILNEFDSTLLANEDRFTDDFYKRFTLVKRRIKLGDVMEKEYFFPTLYGDVTCAQAIFLCGYEEALKLMPHPKIKPIRARKDRAVLAMACYIYNDVYGIPPYNEIALMIAVDAGKESRVLLPLIFNNYSGYYVFSMPVTSRENCLRGNHIWGLPKVTQEIDFTVGGGEAVVVAREEDGAEYFRLRVPTSGKNTPMDEKTNLFSLLNGSINKAETNFKGNFAINKNMGVLMNPNKAPDKTYLTLSDTPSGAAIKRLNIDPMPLQTRFVEHMTACFDFYDESYTLN